MKVFILDVDGVLTTGQFIYSKNGKIYKIFGPDDSDALNILKKYINILFVTADLRGYEISKKRIVDDMGHKLELVNQFERKNWIAERYDLKDVIFMGDGIFDYEVMKEVGYSIAPSNAFDTTKLYAKKITKSSGGNRAVAEACLHILEVFFNKKFPNI